MQSGKDNWAQALLLRLREGIPWGSDDITTIIQMQEGLIHTLDVITIVNS